MAGGAGEGVTVRRADGKGSGMRFRVLALDYDGTIASDDGVPPPVREAIEEARDHGIAVLIVTGRRLEDLGRAAGDLRFVDAVVAEGGAVVMYPESGRSFALAAPPPAVLIDDLARLGVPCVAGQSVVETDARFAPAVLQVIRNRELPLVLLFNRSRLMVLPQSVSKATGLRNALSALRLSPHNALAIGDAENDHALLAACEVGVAAGWGSPALKSAADEVVEGKGPVDLAPYLRRAVAEPVLRRPAAARRAILLGSGPRCGSVFLPVHGRNVLIAGDTGSGKSWITGLLCEQLILAHYSVCVIDPEGDYVPLEALPGVVVLGQDGPPSLREVERAIRYPDVSVVVDLSAMSVPARLDLVPSLLRALDAARRQRGFPHRIVVDEAHYFLHGPEAAAMLDLELAAYTLTSYKVASLDARILQATDAVIVTRETDSDETRALQAALGGAGTTEEWHETLAGLGPNEAVLVTTHEPGKRRLQRFLTAPRLTTHVRHRHKYTDIPVPAEQAFTFTRDGRALEPPARTLAEFSALLVAAAPDVVEGHVSRRDFSRWIGRVYRDRALASRVASIEQARRRPAPEVAAAVVAMIEERYLKPVPGAPAGEPAITSVPA